MNTLLSLLSWLGVISFGIRWAVGAAKLAVACIADTGNDVAVRRQTLVYSRKVKGNIWMLFQQTIQTI